MKKFLLLVVTLLMLVGCSQEKQSTTINEFEDASVIVLNNNKASIDGALIEEYSYTWHLDSDSEDEYYTGEEPKGDIYIAHDIIYYPEIDSELFSIEEYDGEREWVTYYTNEELKDYIFGCLPVLGDELPTEMMHSKQEAYNNPVLHINKAGNYVLEGNWNGQIWIDLGEDAFDNEEAKVKLIMNGVTINCSVAPGVVFYNVYECDNKWEEREEYSNIVDTSDAGARVEIVDGTINNVTGANVYRLLKPKYKKEGSTVQKKRWKMDGAFYSYESMAIESSNNGSGILNITSSTFEGLDCELHMTINSGIINIVSQDDGINVNEDGVSVLTINGGRLTIFAGQGAEGDVVDSNGYIVVNGGTVLGTTPSFSDNMLDSDAGTTVSENATVISSVSGKEMSDMHGFKGERGEFDRDFKPDGQEPPEFQNGQPPQEPPNGFGQRPDEQQVEKK